MRVEHRLSVGPRMDRQRGIIDPCESDGADLLDGKPAIDQPQNQLGPLVTRLPGEAIKQSRRVQVDVHGSASPRAVSDARAPRPAADPGT